MKKVLENVTLVATIVACIVLVILGGMQIMERLAKPVALKAGDKVELSGVPIGERTLVAAVAQGCKYCEQSYPFYRVLQEKADFRLIASRGPLGFYHERGFNVSTVYLSDFKKLHITGTPTLFLLDSSGKVQKVWQGLLSSEKEKEVLAFLVK